MTADVRGGAWGHGENRPQSAPRIFFCAFPRSSAAVLADGLVPSQRELPPRCFRFETRGMLPNLHKIGISRKFAKKGRLGKIAGYHDARMQFFHEIDGALMQS